MALIKCKECGHDVSDKASVCPNCGCPIEKGTNHVSNKPVKNSKTKSWFLLALLLCLIMGGGYYAFNNLFNGGNGKDAIVKLTPKFANAIQKYEKLGSFSEGLAAVMRDGKWGYINTKGDEVIECQYERVGNFSEGLSFVYKSDDESFSVINANGKETFKGKCGFSYFLGSGVPDEVWDDILPYYKNGKLFVPYGEKYVVYDNKGNKISEVDIETDLDSQNTQALPYMIFAKENGDDDFQYNTVGLKDDNGAELIPAIYDGIGNVGLGERINASNGVLLVVLDEIGEDVIEGYGGGFDSSETKRHYGYVDLKGNDTFSKDLKEKCQKSKEKAVEIIREQKESQRAMELEKEKNNRDIDWIQGNWRSYMTDLYGARREFRVGIAERYITVFLGGSHYYTGPYEISDDMITFKDMYLLIDFNRKVIKADRSTDMHRF